jgi:hypothetical protein
MEAMDSHERLKMVNLAILAALALLHHSVAIRLGIPRLQSDHAKNQPLPESRRLDQRRHGLLLRCGGSGPRGPLSGATVITGGLLGQLTVWPHLAAT